MAESEDRDGRAAEYALGTLDLHERQALEAELAHDSDVEIEVRDWERRLAPLALALEPIAPPSALRGKIMTLIDTEARPRTTANVVNFERRAKVWRVAAIASWAMAAALAGVLLFKPAQTPEGRYVAVLQSEGPGPAFVASIDIASGTISVRPVAEQLPADKSYELWAVGGGRDKPQSLGVIDAAFTTSAARLGTSDRSILGDTVFAVSLEPKGGSPTGQPTGPVLFSGKLVAVE